MYPGSGAYLKSFLGGCVPPWISKTSMNADNSHPFGSLSLMEGNKNGTRPGSGSKVFPDWHWHSLDKPHRDFARFGYRCRCRGVCGGLGTGTPYLIEDDGGRRSNAPYLIEDDGRRRS